MNAVLGNEEIMAFVSTTDLDRARAFYEGVLGLTVDEVSGFACVLRGGGRTLRVTLTETLTPQPFTVLGWLVPDIDAMVVELGQRGVEFNRYDGMDQDALGVWTAPSGGRIAWFRDPDQNVLSLTQL